MIVTDPPEFDGELTSDPAVEGREFSVHCRGRGNPPVQYAWLKVRPPRATLGGVEIFTSIFF